ncbi:MAG: methyl-accepting chemotaxis protein [Polyangiaceae bacterium]
MWTFGRRIAAGFALAFLLLLGIGTVAYRSIDALTRSSYSVSHAHQVLEHLETTLSLLKDAETGARGFALTGQDAFLEPHAHAVVALPATLRELRELMADSPGEQRSLDKLDALAQAKLAELEQVIDLRRSQGLGPVAAFLTLGAGKRAMDDIRAVVADLDREQRAILQQRASDVESSSGGARSTILGGTLLCLLLVGLVASLLTRSLSVQIGSAVAHVQSSSAELQTAANQQVSGAKEQATAVGQISTTIQELLTTSRQIAESARKVAQIAQDAGSAARGGEQVVSHTQEAVGTIKKQVDTIVSHMLDLGRKSQQIGSVLELVNELAEQTNILAINATIEAAGAGEVGRRFGVVADEIRKLADRVGNSTKEIRTLVEDIRASVNTTVMATEGGAKAVDAGQRQFGEAATSFQSIAGLVLTTSDAAREIELSTKQQSTAVEQVNLAMMNVSQAARESESTSTQTLQTSSQLAALSRSLSQLIRPGATG